MDLTKEKSRLVKTGFVLAVILCAYFATKIITEVKGLRFIGGGVTAGSTISFSGKGEVSGSPDLATISLTIRESAADVKTAQGMVTTKEAQALSFLDKSGIAKKDIKTENYSSYPKYDYGTPCYYSGVPCRQESPKIIGYEVSENITVKIHDITKAGDVLQGLGGIKVAEISGPNFSIEDEDNLKEQARKMAINDAKKQAEVLAHDLGVHLVRIVNFSESGNYPMPMYYGKEMAQSADSSAGSPQLPTGENKITSNVTITYEIR